MCPPYKITVYTPNWNFLASADEDIFSQCHVSNNLSSVSRKNKLHNQRIELWQKSDYLIEFRCICRDLVNQNCNKIVTTQAYKLHFYIAGIIPWYREIHWPPTNHLKKSSMALSALIVKLILKQMHTLVVF